MSQFILINKPVGPTSHDVVDFLRQITNEKRIGHAGTLDPFASGLLLLAIGRESTRQLSQFVGLDKEYVATLQLGAVSNTYDLTGKIEKCQSVKACPPNWQVSEKEILGVLKNFLGKQTQIPPMFSAKKIKGKKLYQLARQGKVVERKACPITIYQITLKNFDQKNNILEIKVKCSSGTYIRTLGHDIGQQLGCGAYLTALERISIGPFKLSQAMALENLTTDNWKQALF